MKRASTQPATGMSATSLIFDGSGADSGADAGIGAGATAGAKAAAGAAWFSAAADASTVPALCDGSCRTSSQSSGFVFSALVSEASCSELAAADEAGAAVAG